MTRPPAARLALLVVALFAAAFLPGLAIASGPHLRWNECYGEPGALLNRDFACDVNTGTERIVCSFSLAAPTDSVVAVEITIDLVSAGPVLPPWWEYKNPGTCRLSALSLDLVDDPIWTQCFNRWPGASSGGGIASYSSSWGPDRARIRGVVSTSFREAFPVPAGEETFAANLRISHLKTVDAGACTGCTIPVCLVLQQIRVLSHYPLQDTRLDAPATEPESYYVTWQGGVGSPPPCPAATPARDRTWGAIKSIYR